MSADDRDRPNDARAQVADHLAVGAGIEPLLPVLREVTDLACQAFAAGHRLYSFGNGGSAADAQHLAAELIGRYLRTRRPLPAVALTVDPSVVTCIANDFDYDQVFARQVTGLATAGDIVVAFSTSGRSANVVEGLAAARRCGATTVLFAGGTGGPAIEHADHALIVPSETTARIQEMHLLLLHVLSDGIDAWAAGESGDTRPGASG
jgi:D-sedoheptulose 7-phosphate isomerase